MPPGSASVPVPSSFFFVSLGTYQFVFYRLPNGPISPDTTYLIGMVSCTYDVVEYEK